MTSYVNNAVIKFLIYFTLHMQTAAQITDIIPK